MSKILVGYVTSVEPHPKNNELNNKLDVVTISDKINVANRLDDDQPRYKIGDYAAMIPENFILPEWLLKKMGLWNDNKSKGVLSGKQGNRTKSRNIQGVLSEVALVKLQCDMYKEESLYICDYCIDDDEYFTTKFISRFEIVFEGKDITDIFEVEQYIVNEGQ